MYAGRQAGTEAVTQTGGQACIPVYMQTVIYVGRQSYRHICRYRDAHTDSVKQTFV